jgi:adenylate cyclase
MPDLEHIRCEHGQWDPVWIDPVCKMHAPYAAYRRADSDGPWFCSQRCEEAYRRSPRTYPLPR